MATTGLELMKQGAEAKLYFSDFYGRPCIVKERFAKSYRHPTLDKALTTQRLKSEVRANLRCRMAGIPTPTVFMVNFENSCIYMEHIQKAVTVREHIAKIQESCKTTANVELIPLVEKIGCLLRKMHENNIIHGDLTTSNILLRGNEADLDLILIDFGLSSFDASAEDKGVDLYVLERAFLSSHPNTQEAFKHLLNSYQQNSTGKKSCQETMAKLEEVRQRGRKRTMVG